jgi:site-specific DNA recombinase
MKKIFCAIYTRKLSEDGLKQESNSLDTQGEACANFITTQRIVGWVLVHLMTVDCQAGHWNVRD